MNDPDLAERAEIIREKGTDRSRFFRGEVDKYTWQEPGSSFLPGELVAAFLWAQLEEADSITKQRLDCWHRYHELLEPLEAEGFLRRPVVPEDCQQNAHMYYILLAPKIDREAVLRNLKREGIWCVFHYVPLHSSPAGKRYGRPHGDLRVTNSVSNRLIRLPMWVDLSADQQEAVAGALTRAVQM